MTHASEFYTATMAKLYAEQGYLSKAAEIYRHLVARHPERADLRDALAVLEERMAQQQTPSPKELGLLLREWVDLMMKYKGRAKKQ